MAAISRPLASYGFDGITTFTPQMCVKIASGLCECVWPPRMPPPQGVRITTGAENSPARAVTDARELARDLVEGRVDVVGELDFGHGLAGR